MVYTKASERVMRKAYDAGPRSSVRSASCEACQLYILRGFISRVLPPFLVARMMRFRLNAPALKLVLFRVSGLREKNIMYILDSLNKHTKL